VGSQ
jgi:hypothetical protein